MDAKVKSHRPVPVVEHTLVTGDPDAASRLMCTLGRHLFPRSDAVIATHAYYSRNVALDFVQTLVHEAYHHDHIELTLPESRLVGAKFLNRPRFHLTGKTLTPPTDEQVEEQWHYIREASEIVCDPVIREVITGNVRLARVDSCPEFWLLRSWESTIACPDWLPSDAQVESLGIVSYKRIHEIDRENHSVVVVSQSIFGAQGGRTNWSWHYNLHGVEEPTRMGFLVVISGSSIARLASYDHTDTVFNQELSSLRALCDYLVDGRLPRLAQSNPGRRRAPFKQLPGILIGLVDTDAQLVDAFRQLQTIEARESVLDPRVLSADQIRSSLVERLWDACEVFRNAGGSLTMLPGEFVPDAPAQALSAHRMLRKSCNPT